MSEVTVVNNPTESRFEAQVDGLMAGRVDYVTSGSSIDLQHTVVEPGHEGEGIAATMVRQVLERLQVDKPRLTVIPTCPYIKRFLSKNPEFQALTDPEDPSLGAE